MKQIFIWSIFILSINISNSQILAGCQGAPGICAGFTGDIVNESATEDSWYPACYSSGKTTWHAFTTNTTGGDVNITVSGSCEGSGIIQGVIVSSTNCDVNTFTEHGCSSGSATGFTLSAPNLQPHTEYWLQVSGASGILPADCEYEITLSGQGIEASSTTSVTHVVCEVSYGSVIIENTNAGPEPYSYSMESQTPQSGNSFENLKYGLYSATITDANGCSHEVDFFVDGIDNHLSVDAGPDKTILQGGSVQLNAEGNGIDYYWHPQDFLNDPFSQTPTASPASSLMYTAYTYSEEGCYAADSLIVNVLPPVIIYNAFTPNEDGNNDTWQIRNIDLYPNNEVAIYSRWGQKVFETTGYGTGNEWDGKHLGKDLPAATYYYVLDLNAETDDTASELFRGSVTIIR